jgi:hypothetical protein
MICIWTKRCITPILYQITRFYNTLKGEVLFRRLQQNRKNHRSNFLFFNFDTKVANFVSMIELTGASSFWRSRSWKSISFVKKGCSLSSATPLARHPSRVSGFGSSSFVIISTTVGETYGGHRYRPSVMFWNTTCRGYHKNRIRIRLWSRMRSRQNLGNCMESISLFVAL